MQIGVQLPEVEYQASWGQMLELAHVAESVGLDSIWVGDHLLYDDGTERAGPWECWSLLAALAAVTERVEIGPLVAALPFHNPAILAKQAATIDEISGGRLVLGVGAGWNRPEFDAFGVSFDNRVARFEESLAIIVGLLAGDEVTVDGRHVRTERAVLLPPPRRPGTMPLMIGSNGPRMLAVALPYATHWNSWFKSFGNDPDRLPALLEEIDRAWVAAGRGGQHLVKTVALHMSLEPGAMSRSSTPISGSDAELTEVLGQVAATGIEHVQLVLDPILPASVERAGRLLSSLR